MAHKAKRLRASGVIIPPFTLYLKSPVSGWLQVNKSDKRDVIERMANTYLEPEFSGLRVRVTDGKGQIVFEEDAESQTTATREGNRV